MDIGFSSAKDVLDALIVPVSIGFLPWLSELVRRRRFMMLMARELIEMKPRIPNKWSPEDGWHQWLPISKKRFVHEEIFKNPSDNQEFVLSLRAELAYCATQMWHHLEMARQSTDRADQAQHGQGWCDYMSSVCRELGRGSLVKKAKDVQLQWQAHFLQHYGPTPSTVEPQRTVEITRATD